ncbi:hypothetical protein K3495_g4243 [Podosphaera aphanis]|nr:hypothetical protein K3495_g4243 [Podosphaera aphanis]
MFPRLPETNQLRRGSFEDYKNLLDETETAYVNVQKPRSCPSWNWVVIMTLASLFIGVMIGISLPFNLNAKCWKYSHKWSQVQNDVDNSYHIVQFNGSLLKDNVFRLPAGPEVDAAWDSLGVNYRPIAVPTHQAIRSGLKPSQVQINPTYGGGFPANVEGLHHLHCLNLVRQALFFNVEYYRGQGKGAFLNDEYIVRHHVSHCLDIIRQQLMCTPDTGLLGQVWWDRNAPKAFVDFNTEHKCRNYEAIRKWAEIRQLPEDVPEDFLQPPKSRDDVLEEIP